MVTVDLVAPRLTVPATVRVAYRKTAKISYTPRDAHSAMVKVGATVTNAAGTVVASLNLGWVKQGAAHVCAWRPRARGASPSRSRRSTSAATASPRRW